MKSFISLLVIAFVAGCGSMRVSGFITDAETQKPVGTCQVTLAKYYAHSDPAGHYSITMRRKLAKRIPLKLVCEGYETRSVDVYKWRARSREINLQVTPSHSTQ